MHKINLRQALMHVWVQQSAEAFKFQQYIYFNSFWGFLGHLWDTAHNTIIYPVCLYNFFLQKTIKSYISCKQVNLLMIL